MKDVFIYFSLIFQTGIGYSLAITTPCSLTDISCIRYELAQNSNCDLNVFGSIPSVVRFNNVQLQAPNFNVTLYDQYSTFFNLDECYISAFFINPDRNRAVLAITCPNIQFTAHRAYIQHYPLQEDKYFFSNIKAIYPPIIFTADFPHADDIDLCSTYVFPYITGLPTYDVQGLSPAAKSFFAQDKDSIFDHINIYAEDTFSQRSGDLFQLFVNSVLCNFNNYCTN